MKNDTSAILVGIEKLETSLENTVGAASSSAAPGLSSDIASMLNESLGAISRVLLLLTV